MALNRTFFLWDTFLPGVLRSETMAELILSRLCPSVEESLRRDYFLFEQDLDHFVLRRPSR